MARQEAQEEAGLKRQLGSFHYANCRLMCEVYCLAQIAWACVTVNRCAKLIGLCDPVGA